MKPQLWIQMLKANDSGLLAQFPYLPDQRIVDQTDDIGDSSVVWYIVDLADKQDTTAAQDIFLRSHQDEILTWEVGNV